jgi:hypothetical protein
VVFYSFREVPHGSDWIAPVSISPHIHWHIIYIFQLVTFLVLEIGISITYLWTATRLNSFTSISVSSFSHFHNLLVDVNSQLLLIFLFHNFFHLWCRTQKPLFQPWGGGHVPWLVHQKVLEKPKDNFLSQLTKFCV